MKHIPMRLAPLALLLTVVSVCMGLLAILTFSTAGADLRLAEKYAQTVQEQYARECDGQQFLAQAAAAVQAGKALDTLSGTETENGITTKTFISGGAKLIVGIRAADNDIQVVCWKREAQWQPQTVIDGLWDGT